MTIFTLTNYKKLSTGVDGGHHYLSAEVEYAGFKRKMTVLFKSKSDEKLLSNQNQIIVKGNLIDEGPNQSLMLLDAELINK